MAWYTSVEVWVPLIICVNIILELICPVVLAREA